MAVKAGEEVDAWCTKCRMDLGHRVVAVVGITPKRVECLTCNTQHNYRAPKGVKAPVPKGQPTPGSTSRTLAKGPGRPRVTKAAAELKADWEKQCLGQMDSAFVAYTVKERFKVNQLIRHKKFGDGFVSELVDDGKVSIVFADGVKTLVHGR